MMLWVVGVCGRVAGRVGTGVLVCFLEDPPVLVGKFGVLIPEQQLELVAQRLPRQAVKLDEKTHVWHFDGE